MIIRIGMILGAGIALSAAAIGGKNTVIPSNSIAQTNEQEVRDLPSADASLALISQGESLYKRRCTGCHSLDKNRVGPRHRGVYGRQAGSISDFRYSRALQNLDVVWREETLEAWLTNPTAFAPGTSMGFRVRKAEEREAIIAYLKSLSIGSDPITD